MRTWDYSINSLPGRRLGTVTLYRRPWWLSLLEWFAFWICWEWLWKIKLPAWPRRSWGRSHGAKYSPREWWGSVGDLIHAYITNPLFQWCCRNRRAKRFEIELGYERVRELFYQDNPGVFDEEANLTGVRSDLAL